MSFKKDIVLSEADRKALVRLDNNDDFKVFKATVEQLLQAHTYELLSSPEYEDLKIHDLLDDFRGGFNLWRELLDLIKQSYGEENK